MNHIEKTSKAVPSVSVIVPFHNERETLGPIVARLLGVLSRLETAYEVILADDGSTDGSSSVARDLLVSHGPRVQLVSASRRQGKGSALRRGMQVARGEIVVNQDADLEYDPEDLIPIIRKFRDPNIAVVYGSRIKGGNPASYRSYYWGGRLLTAVTNLLFGSEITDEPTGYKAFRSRLLREMPLTSRGFEICPELTGKFLKSGVSIVEVPIRYTPRDFSAGKKIRLWDGAIAIGVLFRIRFFWRPASALRLQATSS